MPRAARGLLLCCGLLGAPAAPALEMLGVGTHLAQGERPDRVARLLQQLPALGVRDEVYWNHFERSPGRYEPTPDLQAAMDLACQPPRAAQSVLVLGYGHPAYDHGGRPRSSEALRAFADYAVKVAERCPAVGHLEIWNEWNLRTGVPSSEGPGNAADYARLVRAVVPRLHAAGYRGRILIGGIGGDHPDWAFTRQLAATGVLDLADGYSVHLYNFARALPDRPAEMTERLARLRPLLRTSTRELPLYITETGWPIGTQRPMLPGPEAAANLRTSLNAFAAQPWIAGVWVYQLRDRRDSADVEDHFGLFDAADHPRSTACVLQQFALHARQATSLPARPASPDCAAPPAPSPSP